MAGQTAAKNMKPKPTTGKHSINWTLFEHMAQDHSLYLTETELHDIRAAALKCEEKESKTVASKVKAAGKVARPKPPKKELATIR